MKTALLIAALSLMSLPALGGSNADCPHNNNQNSLTSDTKNVDKKIASLLSSRKTSSSKRAYSKRRGSH